MTEVEIEKQAIDICNDLDTTVYNSEGGLIDIYDNMEIACRAGIKAGAKWMQEHAVEWHNLRENPNDLPKESMFRYSLKVLNQDGEACKFDYKQHIWVRYDTKVYVKVIAWCELPQFKE